MYTEVRQQVSPFRHMGLGNWAQALRQYAHTPVELRHWFHSSTLLSYFQRTKQWTSTTQKDIEGDQGTFETIFDSLLNKNSKSVDSFLSWENNAIFPSDVVYISFLEKSQSLGAQLYRESSSHCASIASGEVYDAVSRIINMSEQMAQERSCMLSFLWLQIGPAKRLLSTEPVLWPYPNYVGIKRWYLYSSHDFKGF